jgi:hypothetical protein
MAFGFPALIGAGAQVGGGIADFMESRRTADIARTQGKLRKRQSEKRQRKMVGRQIAATGAAGVELSGTTLDKINQTNYEFELDQAIIMESAKLEQDAIKRQGMQDLFGGLVSAGSTLAGGLKSKPLTLPSPNIPTTMGQNRQPINYGVRLPGSLPMLGQRQPINYGVKLK